MGMKKIAPTFPKMEGGGDVVKGCLPLVEGYRRNSISTRRALFRSSVW